MINQECAAFEVNSGILPLTKHRETAFVDKTYPVL